MGDKQLKKPLSQKIVKKKNQTSLISENLSSFITYAKKKNHKIYINKKFLNLVGY